MASKHRNTDKRDPKTRKLVERADYKGPAHEGVREEFSLTEAEYYDAAVKLIDLTPGDWFMIHLASWDLKRTVTFSGKVSYHGVGSSVIEVDRQGDRVSRVASETMVVPLGVNDRDMEPGERHDATRASESEGHVDLSQFCEECGTELEDRVCWTDGCGKEGLVQ